ncbi:16S rRNA (guanine(527)-N(7))-methyltransferase RsmG [Magnetospirillum aberrantis]|uniref:Ribosomal RNA small subunit methyltransferase G n=1 Tax=Magnetospirillum aberrantis SpK TaxID=908842 RepID=A0A7C9QVS6_9PROT|nr:16S rRNA (guanine(527)-N(7))-methyltransferase RsmG [Magnetospirillum aberrantis]NFV81637.1 16S rRNA (guanine(527)-N(7))-methyltransferase RsmG [Magnetospirillum aberrantis SpK]
MTPDEFQAKTAVSRETMERLRAYAEVLVKWQARINLVGPDTIPNLWQRHFLDSAQVFPILPPNIHRLVDMGCGAGFPGLVLAIMGVPEVHLIESDQRKCAFLREAARVTGTSVTIHNGRIEQVAPVAADLVTARALAPLEKLLDWAERHLLPEGHCVFLKGRGVEDELTVAAKEWNITCERFPSLTDPSATILHLKEVRRGRAQL